MSGAAHLAAAALCLGASLWPARLAAQDEHGTPTGLYLIPSLELNFRGERGQLVGGGAFEFGNGPAFGLRAHAWLTELFGVSAQGSYARTAHCQPDIDQCTHNEVTLWHGLAELTVRVKPGVPGYLLFGGGVTVVSPDADAAPAFRTSSHVEPTLTAGAGLDLRLSPRAIFRADLRFYVVIPEEQAGLDVNSRQTDFAIGVGVGYRM